MKTSDSEETNLGKWCFCRLLQAWSLHQHSEAVHRMALAESYLHDCTGTSSCCPTYPRIWTKLVLYHHSSCNSKSPLIIFFPTLVTTPSFSISPTFYLSSETGLALKIREYPQNRISFLLSSVPSAQLMKMHHQNFLLLMEDFLWL